MPKLTVAPHKKAMLVTGDTRECKEQLKALGGGWNKALGGWCFPGSKKDDLLAALQAEPTIELSVHDTAAPAPAAVASSSTVTPGALTVVPHNQAILVTGDTRKVYAQLKALRGRWNPTLGGWIFPCSRQAEVVASLRADPTNSVSVRDESADAAAS